MAWTVLFQFERDPITDALAARVEQAALKADDSSRLDGVANTGEPK